MTPSTSNESFSARCQARVSPFCQAKTSCFGREDLSEDTLFDGIVHDRWCRWHPCHRYRSAAANRERRIGWHRQHLPPTIASVWPDRVITRESRFEGGFDPTGGSRPRRDQKGVSR